MEHIKKHAIELLYNMDSECMQSKQYNCKAIILMIDEFINTGILVDVECGYLKLEKRHKQYWLQLKKEVEFLGDLD